MQKKKWTMICNEFVDADEEMWKRIYKMANICRDDMQKQTPQKFEKFNFIYNNI